MSSDLAAERTRRGAARVYQDDRIQVLWEPKLCIHVQNCVHGLAKVFDAKSRPWIHVEAADADRIAETVVTCPTGALHFHRLDGGPQEEGAADGNLIRKDTRVALCRCGGSANKPFCDGTHRTKGFTA
jgi:uncharacterized Fe-S cluster protein YjdI